MITKPSRRTSRDIRSDSRLDVLHALLGVASTTRSEIARQTGLSTATVTTIVGELAEEGVIVETRGALGGIGRPTARLSMNRDRGRIIGVDVAETYMRTVVFDATLTELASSVVFYDEHALDPAVILDGAASEIRQVLERSETSDDQVLGVGVSLPGIVQGDDGISVVVPHWRWRRLDLDHLRERVSFPLVIDNPLRALTTAELWLGRGRENTSLATVNLGTGVGAGLVIDGRIFRGATNSAGEWGHSLLRLDGRECRCGRRGCVEAYVGAPGIQQTLREIEPGHELASIDRQRDFIQAAAALAASDPAIRETISRTAYYLGAALADLAAVVNPETIALTGWTSWELSEYLLPEAREHLIAQAPGRAGERVRLELSSVAGNPVAIGMATIALERFLVDAGLLTSRIHVAF